MLIHVFIAGADWPGIVQIASGASILSMSDSLIEKFSWAVSAAVVVSHFNRRQANPVRPFDINDTPAANNVRRGRNRSRFHLLHELGSKPV
jgi:hypothetical protein